MQNETFLKAVFKEKGGKLTFTKAIQIAIKIEEVSKVAKQTVNPTIETFLVRMKPMKLPGRMTTNQPVNKPNVTVSPCARCNKIGHTGKMCRYKLFVSNFCKKGHIELACLKKKKDTAQQVQTIKLLKSTPMLKKTIYVDKKVTFEIDTGAKIVLCQKLTGYIWDNQSFSHLQRQFPN